MDCHGPDGFPHDSINRIGHFLTSMALNMGEPVILSWSIEHDQLL